MNSLSESCGIIGAVSLKGDDVLPHLYWGLLTLNHRGQQSYGFLTYSKRFHVFKELGLVADLDSKRLSLWSKRLPGNLGIAHVRYATSGSFSKKQMLIDAQPCIVGNDNGGIIALAYNGNIVNISPLRKELKLKGAYFHTSSDAEILAYEILYLTKLEDDLIEGIKQVMKNVDGAYSVVGITRDGTLFAFRDSYGIRPLVYGFDEVRKLLIIASESVALDVNDVPYNAPLRPGELILVKDFKIDLYALVKKEREALCAFEYAYFARPDSRLKNGLYVYEVRRELGRMLARRYSDIASRIDVIVPIPQTALDAAYGFHEETSKPIEPIIIRHRYVRHRAFIMSPEERALILSKKYNILINKAQGKSIALIDDSIVRGDTLKRIVAILRKAGAKEIHIFSTFPKIISPCFYGIDMASFHELIGFNRDEDEIAQILGADSVNYQTICDFCKAVGTRDLCLACVTGKYPTPYAQRLADKARNEIIKGHAVYGRLTEVFEG